MTTSEPSIPLRNAELLYVAMATAVHVIQSRTDYPVDNIQCVIAAYRQSRNKYLLRQGYTQKQIDFFTEAAAESLVSWLEDMEERKASTSNDFDQWSRELLDE